MITLKEYVDAKQKLAVLNKQDEELVKKHQYINQNIQEKFGKLERDLKWEKNKAEYNAHNKQGSELIAMAEQKQQPIGIIDKGRRIFSLMEIEPAETGFIIYQYDSPRDEITDKVRIPYLPIGTIKDDKYAKIQAFIVDDYNKPKTNMRL